MSRYTEWSLWNYDLAHESSQAGYDVIEGQDGENREEEEDKWAAKGRTMSAFWSQLHHVLELS